MKKHSNPNLLELILGIIVGSFFLLVAILYWSWPLLLAIALIKYLNN